MAFTIEPPPSKFVIEPPPTPEPKRTAGESLGLGVRQVAEGVASVPDMAVNALNALINIPVMLTGREALLGSDPFRNVVRGAADKVGLPTPETRSERTLGAVVEGAAGGLAAGGAGAAVGPVRGIAKLAADFLKASPVKDAIAGGVAGGAAQTAEEAGADPLVQVAAGLAGGVGGYAGAAGAQRLARGAGRKPAQRIAEEALKTVEPEAAAPVAAKVEAPKPQDIAERAVAALEPEVAPKPTSWAPPKLIDEADVSDFDYDAGLIARDLKAARENFDPKDVGGALARAVRTAVVANADVMHGIARNNPNVPAAQAMADALGTNPGSGRLIAPTYEEAATQNAMARINAVSRALGRKPSETVDRAVSAALAGRARPPGAPKVGGAVEAIRRELDDHLTYLREAGLEVGEQRDFFPRQFDQETVLKNPAKFIDKAAEAYRASGLDDGVSVKAARELFDRMQGVVDDDMGALALAGPGYSRHMKGRTWGPEADEIMRDFYIDDTREALASYFRQTTRAAEFARRFGRNGEKADAMFNEMSVGMDPRDVNAMRTAFASSTGRMGARDPIMQGMARGVSILQTVGSLALLPRVMLTSLPEQMAIGVRTGRAQDGLRAIGSAFGDLKNRGGPDEGRHMAEALGILGDAASEAAIAARFGGEGGRRWERTLMNRYMRATGLPALTSWQRKTAFNTGRTYIDSLLGDLNGPNAKTAQRLLNDLGIGADDVPAIKRLAADPTPENLLAQTKEATLYKGALMRFVRQSIQDVTAADRPALASHPVGKLAYGLMSFSYGFQRNILTRAFREAKAAGGKGLTAEERMQLIGPGIALGALVAAGAGWAEARKKLQNPLAKPRDQATWKRVVGDISASGGFGIADPIVQMMTYGMSGDPGALASGPYAGFFGQKATDMAGVLSSRNSEETNRAERRAARAFYQSILTPMISAGASTIPYGGAAAPLVTGGLIAATTPGAAGVFTDAVAGPAEE